MENTQLREKLCWTVVAMISVIGSLQSLGEGQVPNAVSFLIAAITIPMALWYLSRSARAHEAAVEQTKNLRVELQALQLPPEDTLEKVRDNVFHPPS